MQLENGHKLQNGKYRIENKIGQGGFGITYRALWSMQAQGTMGSIDTEIPIVIKEFFWKDYCTRNESTSHVSISSATGKEMFARFKEKLKKEAKILSRLAHPNIVRVLDIFEENNTAYMAMQLIEGESLKDKIARLGKLDEATALKYAQQLCSALNEVHEKQILHLDIKPGNVIIDKNDNAQLIDFGISKQYNDNKIETSTTPIGISKGYAPIEQYSGIEKFSPPTDVYALGATLYTMLTGQIPTEATLLAIEEQEPVRKFNPNVSDRTISTIEKAMEIKPAKRFQTISEFCNALDKDMVSSNIIDAKTTIDLPSINYTKFSEPSKTEADLPDMNKRSSLLISEPLNPSMEIQDELDPTRLEYSKQQPSHTVQRPQVKVSSVVVSDNIKGFGYFKKCWKLYANFKGRARRKEFWFFILFMLIFGMITLFLGFIRAKIAVPDISDSSISYYIYPWTDHLLDPLSTYYINLWSVPTIYFLIVIIPFLAVSVRRLHDVGYRGWMIFVNAIPFLGSIYFFFVMILDGQLEANKWGKNPKYWKENVQ